MTSFATAMDLLHDLADAYAEGDEERVETLLYEIYCDYHEAFIPQAEMTKSVDGFGCAKCFSYTDYGICDCEEVKA